MKKTVIIIMLLAGMMFSPITTSAAEYNSNPEEYLTEDFYMEDGFSSTLPVLILKEDGTVEFFCANDQLSPEDLNSEMKGNYTESEDSVTDTMVSVTDEISLPKRSKKDYDLSFTSDVEALAEELLWEGPVFENWYLFGNMFDKSLLRNYLALYLAGQLSDTAALVQNCEVFREDENGYAYQGVYLIVAFPETDYYEGSDEDQQEGERNAAAEEIISMADKYIFSTDYNEFVKYEQYLDMEKVYDHFIINEMFGNYHEDQTAGYMVDLDEKKLWPTIDPNFEFSLDNDPNTPMEIDEIRIQENTYYQALTKSINFLEQARKRYQSLSNDVLSMKNIFKVIDEAVSELGDAQARDWQRWEHVYESNLLGEGKEEAAQDDSVKRNRNTKTYEEELVKLKYTLRSHSQYIVYGIDELLGEDDMVGEEGSYVRNTGMVMVTLVILFGSIILVKYYTR